MHGSRAYMYMNVLFTQFSQNYLSYRKVISLTTARLLTFFKIQTNQKVFEENSLFIEYSQG